MNLKSYPRHMRPYVYLGIEDISYDHGDKGGKGTCPFCEGDNFYVAAYKDQFKCVHCSLTGNIYTFINRLYEDSQAHFDRCDHSIYKTITKDLTSKDNFACFLEAKKYDLSTVEQWGIIPLCTTFDPVIPLFNHENALSNLCIIRRDNLGKWRPFGCPGLKLHPFRLLPHEKVTPQPSGPRYVCEGLWDAIKLQWALDECGVDGEVWGVPGASNISPDWLSLYFSGGLYLLYDNDYPRRLASGLKFLPGREGVDRTIKLASKMDPCPPVDYFKWGERGYTRQYKDGFDISDLIELYGPEESLWIIEDHRTPAIKSTLPVKPPSSLHFTIDIGIQHAPSSQSSNKGRPSQRLWSEDCAYPMY